MRESVHAEVRELADGGTVLIPVHYRPRALQEKNRWLVLSLTSRIYMEEEERRIRGGAK